MYIDTGKYTFGKKNAIKPEMYKWFTIADYDRLSEYATVYRCNDAPFIAYYIPRNMINILRDAMNNGEVSSDFEPLVNSYGVYVLIGNEYALDHIYIGQAGYRDEDTKGIARLFEHNNSKTESYRELWDRAVYITSIDYDWGKDDIGVVEKLLIEIYEKDSHYKTFNASESPGGNASKVSWATKISGILSLLSLPRIKKPTNISDFTFSDEYYIGEQVEALNKEKEKLEKENNELKNSLKQSDRYAKFGILYDRYLDFKDGLKNAKQLEFKENKISLPNPYTGEIAKSDIEYITPLKIAKEMVNMIPKELFNSKTKFLDIACKSSVFLIAISERLMSDDKDLPINSESKYSDKLERFKHIISEQLFGLSVTKFSYLYANYKMMRYIDSVTEILNKGRNILDYFVEIPNIKVINDYSDKIKHSNFGHKQNGTAKTFNELINETFERDNMQFDVVVGNPPYNDDAYIPFVEMGHKIATKVSLWITLGKWQCKNEATDKEFRYKIVKYIKEIFFYPSCSDIFDIKTVDGITYFILDKNEHTNILVHNKCKYQKLLETTQFRSIRNQEPLLNAMNDVVCTLHNVIGDYKVIDIEDIDYSKKYMVYGNANMRGARGKPNMYQAIGTISYKTGKAGIIGELNISKNTEINRQLFNTSEKIWYTSNDIKNCKSFFSWINTKFVQFCLFGWASTRTINNNTSFGRVPDPGAFDHIFTDKELYTKYGLTLNEQNLIESLIRVRQIDNVNNLQLGFRVNRTNEPINFMVGAEVTENTANKLSNILTVQDKKIKSIKLDTKQFDTGSFNLVVSDGQSEWVLDPDINNGLQVIDCFSTLDEKQNNYPLLNTHADEINKRVKFSNGILEIDEQMKFTRLDAMANMVNKAIQEG